ncbi:MAG: 3-hydroxylacyl-ACP dehydratase [Bacteroidales bacterium]|nr:3-hydroxylacyl-ACP dehydratase [Bacteroidales bacterium]MCF8458645.1 3-hydroxylacyl-ACP dehydratase [Bacteroidales bacterium]
MLIKDFYKIEGIDHSDGQVSAHIKLNPDHEVYDGHFPDQPIVPGVIQLQIIKEILEESLQQKLRLQFASNIKYLAMIIPSQSPMLEINIQYKSMENDVFQASAVIKTGDTVFLKFKGNFIASE